GFSYCAGRSFEATGSQISSSEYCLPSTLAISVLLRAAGETSSPQRPLTEGSQWSQPNVHKHPAPSIVNHIPAKRPLSAVPRPLPDNNNIQKPSSKLPACLKKLVRSIVRTFYSREHSLIVDMLVRNTIMKEDDLCERLRFEKKQLRQYLHTLKTDQFIKSKLQLETDAEGKTTKITHYFIDYKLFVNVVKYRLDQMRRRLEAEQRQTTSRASFRCVSCATTYTDLEVDRLISLDNPGKLECVYCRAEVAEEEDNVSRTDARALIASFHHQVRDPIDAMLRECDEIHLSSSILEPEIRPLEPLKDESERSLDAVTTTKPPWETRPFAETDNKQNSTPTVAAENKVRIVLSGQSSVSSPVVKQRPIWMCDSTINSGQSAGRFICSSLRLCMYSLLDAYFLASRPNHAPCSDWEANSTSLGDLDRGPGVHPLSTPIHTTDNAFTPAMGAGVTLSDSLTQTLTPGRVPTGFSTLGATSLKETSSDASGSANPTSSATSGDIMQLLLIHERRGISSHTASKSMQPSARIPSTKPPSSTADSPEESPTQDKFTVTVGGQKLPYASITSAHIRTMSSTEKAEYIRVGKLVYQNVMD
ncbi:TFIIE alpha subunit, partial [Opisthorchis viverrini]